MRARTFIYALICSTATTAFAQDSAMARFPSESAQACADACTREAMCAAWGFGAPPPAYGQRRPQPRIASGSCTFSTRSDARFPEAMTSGRPRLRSSLAMSEGPPPFQSQRPQATGSANQPYRPYSSAPMAAANPQMMRPQAPSYLPPAPPPPQQSATANPAPYQRPYTPAVRPPDPAPWAVRPAPWLNGGGAAQRPAQVAQRQPAMTPPPLAPNPTHLRSGSPEQASEQAMAQQDQARIEFDGPPARGPTVLTGPRAPAPTPAPPPMQQAYLPPPPPRPAQRMAPPQAPQASAARQALPAYQSPPTAYALPPRVAAQAAQGYPSKPEVPEGPPGTIAAPAGDIIWVDPPARAREATSATPATTNKRRRLARGTPKKRGAKPVEPAETAAPSAPGAEMAAMTEAPAVPPRQNMEEPPPPPAQPAPVKDPYNPESFRDADGMVDSAAMRRAQLDAARKQGSNAYSVQSEWEAIEYERQRAKAAGEPIVDPLAGTAPVPPPPETRSERRVREAEEAAQKAQEAAEEARNVAAYGMSDADADAAPAKSSRKTMRKARGVPRKRTALRNDPPRSIDREPRLSGGPG